MKTKIFLATVAAATLTPAIVSEAAQGPFDDVPANHPYATEIGALKEAGIITGANQLFSPQATTSREHLVVMLSRFLPLTPIREAKVFKDRSTFLYPEAIDKAYRAGVIDGQNEMFTPKGAVTRAQMAKIIVNAFALQPRATAESFSDVPAGHWAKDVVDTLASYGITTGVNGKFNPDEPVTRAHMAVFLSRAIAQQTQPSKFFGDWQGVLALPVGELEIELTIGKEASTISIPAQGLINYPMTTAIHNGNLQAEVKIDSTTLNIEGTFVDGKIEAMFIQNGAMFNMLFEPLKQEPVSYETITVPVVGGNLQAALQLPSTTNQPTPVAIIIAGSGPTDKDGNSMAGKNNSLKMLAEQLAEQGIATLRFDKRGVGVNAPLLTTEEGLVVTDYAQDVEALIGTMNKDSRFTAVHLIGHSEGAFMASLAAKQLSVASIVTLAGAGRPIGEVLREQLAQQPAEVVKEAEGILAQLEQGQHVAEVSPSLLPLFRPSVQDYMISWLAYDPAQVLQETKVKSLIIQGKNDLQVKPSDAERLKQFTNSEVVYFANMNHVLKDAPQDVQGNIATYSNPTLPLTEGLVTEIANFIK